MGGDQLQEVIVVVVLVHVFGMMDQEWQEDYDDDDDDGSCLGFRVQGSSLCWVIAWMGIERNSFLVYKHTCNNGLSRHFVAQER